MTKRAKRKDLFGEILTQIREEAGMTTAEAARESGLFPHQINDWELGKISPTLRTLERLLNLYGYEVEIVKK
jgi:transcriptional regulator with XRE-family HTH domain